MRSYTIIWGKKNSISSPSPPSFFIQFLLALSKPSSQATRNLTSRPNRLTVHPHVLFIAQLRRASRVRWI